MKKLTLIVGLLLVSASSVSAQVRWDSPFLTPPRPQPGVTAFMIDVAGGGLGGMITWIPTQTSWGLRFGLADEPGDEIGVFGGGDVSGAITRANRDFPFDMDWVFGLGLGISDFVVLSVPVGLTL